jgi:pSer/pThr/pTyr-binding forkhead associated (FHA) protein
VSRFGRFEFNLARRQLRCDGAPVHLARKAFEPPIEHAESKPTTPTVHWLLAGERRLPLGNGENLVGRATRADVWIDHSTVSRHHARIFVAGTEARVEHLRSKNGTSVGGNRLAQPLDLRDGDRVAFGQVPFTYRRIDSSPSTVTQLGRVEAAAPSS